MTRYDPQPRGERLLRIGDRTLLVEPVDGYAVCVSGTFVVLLLMLGVPLSEQAQCCQIPLAALRRTVRMGRRQLRARHNDPVRGREVLTEAQATRLQALLGVTVADEDARPSELAEAWALGCEVSS